MSDGRETDAALRREIRRIEEESAAERIALAHHDYASGSTFAEHGEDWFHAASTIKIPILLGVFAAVEEGRIDLKSRVHVRNRFVSVADGRAYRLDAGRDATSEVYLNIGKTMRVHELARHMIVTSSNLATNLLVDLVGIGSMQETLERIGARGVELRRGVEDERAHEAGIDNRVTASGLVGILRLIEEGRALSRGSCDEMLRILHEQEFRSGIPAGLPNHARVAHKTGEISTMAHDAGLVYLPGRAPYALAILTRWPADATTGRRETLAAASRAVFQHLTAQETA